jgi:hypothetical protein
LLVKERNQIKKHTQRAQTTLVGHLGACFAFVGLCGQVVMRRLANDATFIFV